MLKRLLLFVPLLFVLLSNGASIDVLLKDTGLVQSESFNYDDCSDGVQKSTGISKRAISFYETEEEEDDDDDSSFLRSKNKTYCNTNFVEISGAKYSRSFTCDSELYILFHSWKIDLLK